MSGFGIKKKENKGSSKKLQKLSEKDLKAKSIYNHIQGNLDEAEILFSKIENYCGLIDQFIVSDECKYSSDPVTGSFESGYLDSDLGPDVYVKELNVRTDAIFSPENGKYPEPIPGVTKFIKTRKSKNTT